MHAINYEAPKTLKDAVALLAQHGEKGRPLCGGTDLIIQLRAGVRRPEFVVDVKKIPDLLKVSYDAKKGLRLGAAVPAIEVCENNEMQRHYPGLIEAAHLIGSTADPEPRLGRRQPVQRVAGGRHHAGADRAGREGARRRPQGRARGPGRGLLHRAGPHRAAARRVAGRDTDRRAQAAFADAYLRFIPRNEMDIAVVGVGARRCIWTATRWARRGSRLGRGRADADVRGQGVRVADRQEARRRGASTRACKLAIELSLADRRHARHGRVPPPYGRRADPAHAAHRGRARAQGVTVTGSTNNRQEKYKDTQRYRRWIIKQ